jgi:hypothetical protein
MTGSADFPVIRAIIVAAALAAALAPLPARAIERWYSQGFYPWLQQGLTPVTNLVPFALFDPAVLGLSALALLGLTRRIRRQGATRALLGSAVTLVTAAASAYLVFLLCWGFNYRRLPLDQKLDFDSSRISREGALDLAREAVGTVNALHAGAQEVRVDEHRLFDAVVEANRALGADWRFAAAVPKRSLLELYFRRAAIDGMTDPFFLQIILNTDVLPFERPFVLAHEWAHLSGYADESEASFVAWLACLNGDRAARYSAWLAVYGSVSGRLPREDRRAIAAGLAAGPRADLQAAARRYALAVPAVTRVARDTYDVFLRANRVEEGIDSYDAVVRLILGTSGAADRIPRLRTGHQPR